MFKKVLKKLSSYCLKQNIFFKFSKQNYSFREYILYICNSTETF